MADDDIERLLREIDATTAKPTASPSASSPATRPAAEVEATGKSAGGRLAFAAVAGVAMGAGAFLFAVFTPWTDAFDMGMAGAGAAFITALVAGPPRWFSS